MSTINRHNYIIQCTCSSFDNIDFTVYWEKNEFYHVIILIEILKHGQARYVYEHQISVAAIMLGVMLMCKTWYSLDNLATFTKLKSAKLKTIKLNQYQVNVIYSKCYSLNGNNNPQCYQKVNGMTYEKIQINYYNNINFVVR